jgi:hypothetical protein
MKNKNKLIYFKEVKKVLDQIYDFSLYGPKTTINYFENEVVGHDYEIEYLTDYDPDKITLNHYIGLKSLSFSDYHGSTHQQANIRYMEKNFPEYFEDISDFGRPLMEIDYGHYCSETLIISVKALLHPEIKSIILSLQDYPVICEDTLHEVEQAAIDENIESWLARDFENYLVDDRDLGNIDVRPLSEGQNLLEKEVVNLENLSTEFFGALLYHFWQKEIIELDVNGTEVWCNYAAALEDSSDKEIIEAIRAVYDKKFRV